MTPEREPLLRIIDAALLASPEPLQVQHLKRLFPADECPTDEELQAALEQLADDCKQRSCELQQVAGGFCYRVREDYSPWLNRLSEQRPQRYSRALLEVLALIAYRQPITRGQIEEVRGVSLGSGILHSLMDRDWIRIVGRRDVPGRPALYATTQRFLDDLGLRELAELPPLQSVEHAAAETALNAEDSDRIEPGDALPVTNGDDVKTPQ